MIRTLIALALAAVITFFLLGFMAFLVSAVITVALVGFLG